MNKKDPLIERERNISKQKAIEEEIDRLGKDYYNGTASEEATKAVEAIVMSRGKLYLILQEDL